MAKKPVPCIKCGGTNIVIGDCNYSAFNYFQAICTDCKHEVSGQCGTFPKMDMMVGSWNNENDPNKIVKGYNKAIKELEGKIAALKQKIVETKFWGDI